MRSGLGGPCSHCGRTSSPCWRKGPPEKPLLCNACGARYLVKRSLEGYLPGQKPPKREGAAGAKTVAAPRSSTQPSSLRGVAQGSIGKRKRVLNPRYAAAAEHAPPGWKGLKDEGLGVKAVLLAAGTAAPGEESPRVSTQDSAASHFTTTAALCSVERTSSQESTDAQPSSFDFQVAAEEDAAEELRATFTTAASKVRATFAQHSPSPPPSPCKSLRAAGRCRKKSRPAQAATN